MARNDTDPSIQFRQIDVRALAELLKLRLVNVLGLLVPDRSQVPGSSWMLAGILLDAGEVYRREILRARMAPGSGSDASPEAKQTEAARLFARRLEEQLERA